MSEQRPHGRWQRAAIFVAFVLAWITLSIVLADILFDRPDDAFFIHSPDLLRQ